MRVTTRLQILVTAVIAVTMWLNLLVLSNQVRAHLEENQREWVETLAAAMAEGITNDTINGNKLHVSELLFNLAENDRAIEYAYVTDMEGDLFAYSFRGGLPRFIAEEIAKGSSKLDSEYEPTIYRTRQGDIIEYHTPLVKGLLAHLHLGLNSSEVNGLLNRVTQSMGWVILLVGSIGFTLAWLFGYGLSRPLIQFTDQLSKMAEARNTELPEFKTRDPDIQQMVKAFRSVINARDTAENEALVREQNLSLTLNSIGDGVIVTNNTGQVTRMNAIAEQLTGWMFAEANGAHLDKVFPIINATTKKAIETPVNKVLSTAKIVTLENHTTLISKDGSEYQIADSAAPIFDEHQNILGVILVFHDVTEQYKLREIAARNAKGLANAQRLAHIGNWELDLSTNKLTWSDEVYRIFEIKPENFNGTYADFLDAIHPDDREKVHNVYTESLNKKSINRIDHRIRMPDGRIKHVFEICENFYDEKDIPIRSTGTVQDITERVNSEEKLRYNEARLAEAQEIAHLGSWDTNIQTGETVWSKELYKLLGYEPYEVEAKPDNFYARIHKDDLDYVKHELERPFREKGQEYQSEFRIVLPDNTIRIVAEQGKIIEDDHGKPWRYAGTTLDITERRNQDEKLRRIQKMDALGKLTGGIAHDYNNLLGIIMGYAEQINDHLSLDNEIRKYARSIVNAAYRGSKLTNKLLTFSRNRKLDTTVLDINATLTEQQLMLEKTLTARIRLTYNLTDNVWPVEADNSELEDVILNLSINAQHAMADTGELTISTRNVTLDTVDAHPLHLRAGDYVQLCFTDTGSGMDESTKDKVFDPFFTTKGEQGTGLGLSQAYGFVERSGGTIIVYSEPGHGSRFVLYLPRSDKTLVDLPPLGAIDTIELSGNETILVVDDEPDMVELAYYILSAHGYRVFTASDGPAALAILEEKKETFDLIITDVIMPNMNGYQLAARAKENFPHIKIQLVSGFADNRHTDLTDDTLHQNVLYKPYTSIKLLSHVRTLLNEENSIDEPKNASEYSLVGRTIIVLDDDPDVRELLKLRLGKLQCNTLEACNGDEAIALYKQSIEDKQVVDAVIVDLTIPGGKGGKEVAHAIRTMDPQARLIVASGDTFSLEMRRYQDYGFNGALEKTFNQKIIKQTLEEVLVDK